MELEKQVTSIDLSNKLKKLGLTKPSIYFRDWTGAKEDEIEQNPEPLYNLDNVNCYTVAELGEMLPKTENIVTMYLGNGYVQTAIQGDIDLGEGLATRWGAVGKCILGDTEADARAKMLIYLLENKLMGVDYVR